MLKVYYGTSEGEVRAAALASAKAMGEVVKVTADEYQPGCLLNYATANSLFGGVVTYLLDSPATLPEFWAECLASSADLAKSEHTFILVEKTILAADKKILAKSAATMEEFKAGAAPKFNAFGLSDALAAKDKRSLWLELQAAKAAGLVAEEIIGTLWWQLKTMRLAALTSSAAEAGVKDYPYRKAKEALRKFNATDVARAARKLSRIYHDSRHGKCDLDLALEEWVLKL